MSHRNTHRRNLAPTTPTPTPTIDAIATRFSKLTANPPPPSPPHSDVRLQRSKSNGNEKKKPDQDTIRRSFCESHIELSDFLSINGVKVVSVDMPPFMIIHAVNCARKAHDSMEKQASKTLAFALKKEFDKIYGPAWHCIVGTGFGSFVTHSVGGFLYFSMDHKLYVLLFKTAVQRAD